MQTTASQRLLAMSLSASASVAEQGEAVQLRVNRNTLEVIVTVPTTVHEWFVEATDVATGARTEDWCDYDGYDASSIDRLDLDMAEDVSRFVQRLLSSELKLESGSRARLLWKVSDSWQQAVPLGASAV
jgi:hypothetical protein